MQTLDPTVPIIVGAGMRETWTSRARTVSFFALAYFLADTALNRFAFSDGWTIIWPLNGVTVALLLKRPRAKWVWMLLGVEFGTTLGECLEDNTVLFALGQRICSATEVLICAVMLPRFIALEDWLRTPRIHARFFAALLLGPGISGAMAAFLFNHVKSQPWLLAFNDWATSDALGIAATLPLALSFDSQQMRQLFSRPTLPRTLMSLVVAMSGAVLVFSVSSYTLTFLLFPIFLLIDSLLAFAGSSIAVVGVCLLAVYFTTKGWGPFGLWPSDHLLSRDLAFQLYFGFHVVALFPASILQMERRRLTEELARSNAHLTVLASLDGLTGIGNRRVFDERLDAAWQQAVNSGSPLALAILDLDNFKQFNDLYGHAEGDRCLKAVGEVLKVEMRRPDDLVARFGGEEFVMLLPNTTVEGAHQASERVRAAVFNLGIKHLGNPTNRVSVSVGYASVTPTSVDTRLGLIQLADAALYRAKREGRNCVETILSVDGLCAANDHFGDTTRIRLIRMLTGKK